MDQWTHRIVIALVDDGYVLPNGEDRMTYAGQLTAAVSGEAADLASWSTAQPRRQDELGRPYAVLCAQLRPQDAAPIPAMLGLVCPDADVLEVGALSGRAYAADGQLLGGFEFVDTPAGPRADPQQVLEETFGLPATPFDEREPVE